MSERWFKILLGAALLLASSAILLSVVLFVRASDQQTDINQSRVDNIHRACVEQNNRNRKAYVFLQGLPVNPNGPKLTAEARTKLIHGFTDALVGPKRDCSAYADSLVRP